MEIRLAVIDSEVDEQGVESMMSSLVDELKGREIVAHAARIVGAEDDRAKSAGDVVGWGQMLLTLAGSGGALVTFIACAKDWLLRQPPTTTIKIVIGNDVLELNSNDREFVSKTTQEFIASHQS